VRPSRLTIALRRLVDNAIKFAAKRAAIVERVQVVKAARSEALVRVERDAVGARSALHCFAHMNP